MTNNSIREKNESESDFGILSMEESVRIHQSGSIRSSRIQCDSSDNWVVPKVKMLSQQKSSRFRMIVCGDSGIGKSALVQTLAGLEELPKNNESPFQPIEVFVPDTDICIVDTLGYGALIRADVIFSHVKNYIEQQFEKTNSIFNANYTRQDDNLRYMVYQSSDILSHVDACLYVIMGRVKPIDIEYMRSIHDLVNIIPVILQSDLTLRPEERIEQRLDIINILKKNEINISFVGYNDYQDILNCCKEPMCPPFMLDWSNNKNKLFHGLLGLKKVLYQHQYKYLKLNTTEKFIHWRNSNNNHSTLNVSLSSTSTSSSSQEQVKSNIRISQYITKRRHSIEREMLVQEKKLIDELENSNKQRRTELILEQLNLLVNHQDFDIKTDYPVTHHYYHYFWIFLSIVLSIFICYQNGSLFITKCMQSQWAK